MTIWDQMLAALPGSLEAPEETHRLLEAYQIHKRLAFTCPQALQISDEALVHFFARLAASNGCDSPAAARDNSGWMADSDFCFFNIRATGSGTSMGNFIQAAKLLPIVRANAIHLAPFTDYDFENIYAVRSVETISPNVVSPKWLALGFSPADQLRAFIEAAHILRKTVGFDLEPHVAQYARPVLMRPALFRWYQLSTDRASLAGGLSSEEMLQESQQTRITGQVEQIVQTALRQQNLDTLEIRDGDSPSLRAYKDQLYFRLIGELIGQGFWPIPSQVWSGDGVPAFKEYNVSGNYAVFDYRSRSGEDHGRYAYHVMTPFKLYNDLPPNRCPAGAQGQLNPPAVDYFSEIFLQWRDEFGFDFVRYDSVDHIFDSVQPQDPARPCSDRPTPAILETCVQRSRAGGRPYIGNFAERMGLELDSYAALGFDLILGTDMLQHPNRALIETAFWIHDQLQRINQDRPARFAVPFCVDTHDTGNEHIWGEPLVKISGSRRMRLRHFLSRFLGCGLSRRPKYEVIGAQDLSFGLYRANVSDVNLTWVGDRDYNRAYHTLEDVYDFFRPLLNAGQIQSRFITTEYAWWQISARDEWLVAMVALDTGASEGQPLPPVEIPLPDGANQWVCFDFSAPLGTPLLTISAVLRVENLPYLGFRLYHGSRVVEE